MPIIERDAQNITKTIYIRGLSLGGGIGGIISRHSSPPVYYHYDGLGNVTNLTDSTGATLNSYTYNAFGEIVSQTGVVVNPYLFSSKAYNSTTGLSYFGARYYNPVIGRFINQDPLGFYDGLNLYTYVGNNPVNWIDPWGLCGEKATASSEWWDITSWLLPRTNYGGWTKSGPGPVLSELDSYFKRHDERLQAAGVGWWHMWNKEVLDIHRDLVNSWYIDYLQRREEYDKYPYNSDEYGYLFH